MPTQAKKGSAKILLVDDVKLFLEVEKTFFRRSGFQVLTAHSGEEVLTIARRERPDIILMDYEMPGLKGDEVCRALKADEELRGTPVLIVSQHYSPEILDRCLKAGCEDYLTKPVEREVVLRRVAEILRVSDRRSLRVTVVLTVERGSTKTQFLGHAKNISESGMFLETNQPMKVGNAMQISFFLPRLEEKVTGTVEVVRSVEGMPPGQYGVGIRFLDLPEAAARSIRRFIADGRR